MPILSTAPGPPQSGSSEDGRTQSSGASPKGASRAVMSGNSPAAMPCTASNDSAMVRGTGRSSRTRRCRHFARPPWVRLCTGAVGVIRVISGSSCCTAAPFLCPHHTPRGVQGKGKDNGYVTGRRSDTGRRGFGLARTLPLMRLAARATDRGWAQLQSWSALYGSQILQRSRGYVTLQKRPPEGAVGRSRGGVQARLDSARGKNGTAARGQHRLWVALPLHAGKVGGLQADGADTAEQVEAVAAQHLIVDIDLHRLEKRIDGRAQGGHGPHCPGEILCLESGGDLRLCGVEGCEERLFLVGLGEFHIRAEGIFDAVFFFGLCEDVVGPLEALQQVLTIIRVQERPERAGAVDEQGEIVIALHRKAGVDHVMAQALVAQVDLESVVEEGEEVVAQVGHDLSDLVDQAAIGGVRGPVARVKPVEDRTERRPEHAMMRDLVKDF